MTVKRYLVTEVTSMRTSWQASIAADQVRDLIMARIAYHGEKIERWTAEYNKARQDFKENGVDLDALVNDKYGGTSTMSASLNQDLLNRLQAVKARMTHHQDKTAYPLLKEWERERGR